jgi:hypothetical protein
MKLVLLIMVPTMARSPPSRAPSGRRGNNPRRFLMPGEVDANAEDGGQVKQNDAGIQRGHGHATPWIATRRSPRAVARSCSAGVTAAWCGEAGRGANRKGPVSEKCISRAFFGNENEGCAGGKFNLPAAPELRNAIYLQRFAAPKADPRQRESAGAAQSAAGRLER